MFGSIFSDGTVATVGFFVVLVVSLICGGIYAFLSCDRTDSSFSFAIAAALIPMTVAVVIMLVNGNLGVGVAIAGAFGLVRFRSAPGTAKEISVIFIAMAAGLAFGMGYLAYGAIFLLICGVLFFILGRVAEKTDNGKKTDKILKITIPEMLDYTSIFDDIFQRYTCSYRLEKVKSANMGSMFRLSYRVVLKSAECEKALLDEIRIRNGNLEIQCFCADLGDREL